MSNLSPKFHLGQIIATPGALQALAESGQTPSEFLARHAAGDWGDVCVEDQKLNNQALIEGSRILSAYTTNRGETIWIVTESDRSSTCVLLPTEY